MKEHSAFCLLPFIFAFYIVLVKMRGLLALILAALWGWHVNAWAFNAEKLAHDARAQIGVTVSYDPSYQKLDYPMGDVHMRTGVCTDVVIRAYRSQAIDLQALVHEDMRRHFVEYPKIWGLKKPDKNIDHRRVPNLQTFFTRHGQSLKISRDIKNYRAGDVVTWMLDNGRPHIGIVSDNKNPQGIPLIIHNIGAGVQEENVLYAWPITGHYRFGKN